MKMFGRVTDRRGLKILSAKDRITQLVKAVGGDTSQIRAEYNGGFEYHERHGALDIRITNNESFGCPWVDIYHFETGPVALYRVTDDAKAAELIEEYREMFRETADAH